MTSRLTSMTTLVAGALALAGCGPSPRPGEPLGTELPAADNAIAAGVVLRLRLNQTLSRRINRVGDRFTATVVDAVVASDGRVLVPPGTIAGGTITAMYTSPDADEPIRIQIDRLTLRDRVVPLPGTLLDSTAPAAQEPDTIPAGSILQFRVDQRVPLGPP